MCGFEDGATPYAAREAVFAKVAEHFWTPGTRWLSRPRDWSSTLWKRMGEEPGTALVGRGEVVRYEEGS